MRAGSNVKMGWKVLILLLILTLLLGCGGTGDKSGTVNYKTGIKELEPVFEERFFPREAYQNSPLSLSLVLRNNAAYDTNNVRVSVVGFDNQYVLINTPDAAIERIEGKDMFNPSGGQEDVTFDANVKPLYGGAEYNTQNYRIYLGYDSKIEFAPTVCINPSLYELFDSGCQVPNAPISFGGQGGPLAVSAMRELIRSGYTNEVEFRLTLRNQGKGKVKKVRLGEAKIGNEPMVCELRGGRFITSREAAVDPLLIRQDMEVICVKKLKDRRSYLTPLFVELFYEYELDLRQQLTIRK